MRKWMFVCVSDHLIRLNTLFGRPKSREQGQRVSVCVRECMSKQLSECEWMHG